jgi:hypothetical protein
MNVMKVMTFGIVSICLLLASAGPAVSGEQYSGFLENYPAFEADSDRKGALIYKKPGTELKAYTKIMIDPIEIWYAPDSKYKGIKPDDLKTLADTFLAAIVEELEPDYPVVSKPGPGVLGIRLAITNVYAKKKKRGLLGYTPIGFVATTAKNLAVGPGISLVDATIEVEMLDSQTNERLGALIDRQSASPEKKKKEKTSWEEIEKTLKFYAKRFRSRMDAEQGR